jgi:hypothetical protein
MGTALGTIRTWRVMPEGRPPPATGSPGLVSCSHNHPIGSRRRVRHNGSRLGTIWLVPAPTLLGVKNRQPGRRLRRVIRSAHRACPRPANSSSLPESNQRSFCSVGNKRGSTVRRPDRDDCWSCSRESVGQTARCRYPIGLRAAERPQRRAGCPIPQARPFVAERPRSCAECGRGERDEWPLAHVRDRV